MCEKLSYQIKNALAKRSSILAKSYGKSVLRRNQFGCIRNFTLTLSATFHLN